jgi:hypothetical protein
VRVLDALNGDFYALKLIISHVGFLPFSRTDFRDNSGRKACYFNSNNHATALPPHLGSSDQAPGPERPAVRLGGRSFSA